MRARERESERERERERERKRERESERKRESSELGEAFLKILKRSQQKVGVNSVFLE